MSAAVAAMLLVGAPLATPLAVAVAILLERPWNAELAPAAVVHPGRVPADA